MHTLLQFLSRIIPFFTFLFLELVCFILIINHHHYQRVSYLHSANIVNAFFDNSLSGIGGYFQLSTENEQLVNHNKSLLQAVLNNKVDTVNVEESNTLVLGLKYEVESARVINKTVNKQYNYLTINKGSKDGIKPEMGVIAENGVVGIIKNVSSNFATVMTLIHKESLISAVMKSTNNFGSIQWNGVDARFGKLKDIPAYVNVPIGDSIFTSGQSSIFPDKIFIGTITNAIKEEGDSFYDIEVEFATNFSTLKNIYVINYKLKEEQLKLENETLEGVQ